jgi:hypothetical protein
MQAAKIVVILWPAAPFLNSFLRLGSQSVEILDHLPGHVFYDVTKLGPGMMTTKQVKPPKKGVGGFGTSMCS